VKIRLMRVGKKKQPTYRVVVADARSPRNGRIIETIGKYRPRHEPSEVEVDADKALDWLRKGAQPTEQVQKLLAATGVWATYEGEKGGPVRTKLARRGVTAGTAPPPPKSKKKVPEAMTVVAAPEAAPAPTAAAPAKAEPAKADEPTADEAPADEAPADEAPADEAPAAEAEEPVADAEPTEAAGEESES
jgi:small subunit ribosomal protein S16